TTDGNNISISVTLADGRDGQALFDQQYRGTSSDVQDMESEITRDILNKMGLGSVDQVREDNRRRGTTNSVAYSWYLQGNYAWNQRTPESLTQAYDCYKRAIEADPNFALAYAGLADTYTMLAGYNLREGDAAFPPAKNAAEHAIALNPSLAEPHLSLAVIAWAYEWDWQKAESEFKRAIELN